MQEDYLIECANLMGPKFRGMMTDLDEVPSIGLFGAVELEHNRHAKEPLAQYNAISPELVALRNYILNISVFLYTHWHTMLIIPPLVLTE